MEEITVVESLIRDLLASINYELYSFKYIARAKRLEIIIDRFEPINLDDITLVSSKISELLDNHDFTNDSYTLDVSSLGVEKPIKLDEIDKYVGKYVNLHLSNPYKGLNTLEGDILETNENTLVLGVRDKARTIKINLNKKDIDKARLAIKF